MGTNQSLTDADSELLSAYLDTKLTNEAQQALDQRLAAEPALRTELGDLRATVAVLRELEPVRPPRSFALDPATARAPGLWQLPATWLRLGSAFAVLMLAVTVTFQGSPNAATSSAPAPASAAFADVTSAPAAAAATSAPAALDQTMNSAQAAPEATNDAATGAASSAARSVAVATADASQPGSLAENSGITDPKTSSPDTTSLGSYQSEPPLEVVPPARPLPFLQIGLAALALVLLAASFVVARRRV